MVLTFVLIFEDFHNNNFFNLKKKFSGLWRLSPFLPLMTTYAILGKSPFTSCVCVPDLDVILDIYLSVSLFRYKFAIKLAETLIMECLLCKAALLVAGGKLIQQGGLFSSRGSQCAGQTFTHGLQRR